MTRLLTNLLLLATCLTLSAQVGFYGATAKKKAAGGGGTPTYYLQETFDASGYDNAGWTETSAGQVNEDYTTAPAPLEGTQSLYFAATSTQNANTPDFTAQSEVWVSFQYHVDEASFIHASPRNIMYFGGAADALLCHARIEPAGTVTIAHGTATNTSSATLSVGTTYYFWIRYVKGTGSDGVAEIYWSTTTTPGTVKASVSTGTSTADCIQVWVYGHADLNTVFDDFHVSDAQHSF